MGVSISGLDASGRFGKSLAMRFGQSWSEYGTIWQLLDSIRSNCRALMRHKIGRKMWNGVSPTSWRSATFWTHFCAARSRRRWTGMQRRSRGTKCKVQSAAKMQQKCSRNAAQDCAFSARAYVSRPVRGPSRCVQDATRRVGKRVVPAV